MKEIKYYLWFVPEIIFHPNKNNYISGKIEVYSNQQEYPFKEIKIFTNKELEFNEWFSTIPKIINSLEEVYEVEEYIKKLNDTSITL